MELQLCLCCKFNSTLIVGSRSCFCFFTEVELRQLMSKAFKGPLTLTQQQVAIVINISGKLKTAQI